MDAGMAAQFVDLSGRLQLTNKATNTILQDLKNQASKSDARHTELLQKVATQDQIAALLDARLARIEQLLQNIQRDVEGKDYSSRFNQLHETLRSSHLSLSENLQGHLLSGKSISPSPCPSLFLVLWVETFSPHHFFLLLFIQLANPISSFVTVITASSPRMGFFLFMLIAFQVLLAVSYVIYKRRRANMPKKFL
jgi:mannose-binding lectin 1